MEEYCNQKGILTRNNIGRWSIIDQNSLKELSEITSGEEFELLDHDEKWVKTRMEFNHEEKQYYSIDGLDLYEGRVARITL